VAWVQASWLDRQTPAVFAAIFVVCLVVASLTGNPIVDAVALTHAQGRSVVDEVNRHPDVIRIGFLCIVLMLLSIGPAIRPLRRLAPFRGAALTEVGYRLMCAGAVFGAVGNAFAPLGLGSTAGLDRDVMASFVVRNEGSWVSFVLLGLYALLPAGTIVMGVGLIRAGSVPLWSGLLFVIVFVAILPIPVGYPTLGLAALFAVVYLVLLRPAARAVIDEAPRSSAV
jgi:hypothetical protein